MPADLLAPHPGAPRWRRDGAAVAGIALAARLAVVAWAAGRVPPVADGLYYHRIATRIAEGLGYTWLWPDGAVTYAAHYPIGYPGAVGGLYALFGPRPAVAMLLNAVLGALGALAVHRLAAGALTGEAPAAPAGVAPGASFPRARQAALLAGLLVALHPGLVAYTPALMTEGVTAALIACAAWAAAWARRVREERPVAGPLALGLVVGLATLVRPQCLALAPLLALVAAGGAPRRRAARAAAVATMAALSVCAPWTARNCARMERCALVSVNGGWNLLIGADPGSTGSWAPIQVPEACRDVFDEAGKDLCFGQEARRYIVEHPAAWLALIPRKLASTFDYAGAAGWYLHEASPAAFDDRRKVALGVIETLYERLVLLAALGWMARKPAGEPSSARGWARLALGVVGGVFSLLLHAWIGYAALLVGAALKGRRLWTGPVMPATAVAALGATMATHAVFFGAGRYSLVVFPLLCGLAALGARWSDDES